ncbi:lysostaphin resistance A-like protein [Chloroflexota bacterium]
MAQAVLQPQRNRLKEARIHMVAITATPGMREAVVYFLAVVVAEVVTCIIQPLWGMVCHVIVLVVVIVHSALASDDRLRRLVLSLALLPLVRIMSLSMPLANIAQMWWYPIIYTPLLVAAVVVVRILGWSLKDIGLNFRLFSVQLVIALSGFVIGAAEYLILKTEPMVIELTWQEIWLPALILLGSTGFVEEFIFRGVLQRTTMEVFGWWGIVYVSLLFAIMHMGYLSWIDVAFVFVVALFFGWVVKKTGSLFGAILSHGIANIVLYLVAPFFF